MTLTDKGIIINLATKVMGWTVEDCSCGKALRVVDSNDKGRHFNPLESIADAFEVSEALCKAGWTPTLAIRPFEGQPRDRFIFHGCKFEDGKRLQSFSGRADTAPRAICLAAIEATR